MADDYSRLPTSHLKCSDAHFQHSSQRHRPDRVIHQSPNVHPPLPTVEWTDKRLVNDAPVWLAILVVERFQICFLSLEVGAAAAAAAEVSWYFHSRGRFSQREWKTIRFLRYCRLRCGRREHTRQKKLFWEVPPKTPPLPPQSHSRRLYSHHHRPWPADLAPNLVHHLLC